MYYFTPLLVHLNFCIKFNRQKQEIDQKIPKARCPLCIRLKTSLEKEIQFEYMKLILKLLLILKLFILVGWDRSFRLLLGPPGLN